MKNWNNIGYTRDEALRKLLGAVSFTPRIECVPLDEALLRVASCDLFSRNTLPNCPSSFRDGVCVRFSDFAHGMPDTSHWIEGNQYAYCNTGFGVPESYDTVIMIEDVELAPEGGITLSKLPGKGQYVNLPGCNMEEGELLVKNRTRLQPQHLGLLAAGGYAEVDVVAKPRVRIVPTGNELVKASVRPMPRGMNIESNSVMMAAQLELMGAEPSVHNIICDDPEAIEAGVRMALEDADIVITNGGTSKGTGDWAAEVFGRLGRILVREVDYGPGKHTMMAVADGKPIVGAVGPTIGAECAVEWYVRPLVEKYYGASWVRPRKMSVRLTEDIPIPVSRASGEPISVYRWFGLSKTADGYDAAPMPQDADASQRMLAPIYVSVPKETGGYRRGDIVEATLRFPEYPEGVL